MQAMSTATTRTRQRPRRTYEENVRELLRHEHELVEADDTVAVLVGLQNT
jgi:hypothetical protein